MVIDYTVHILILRMNTRLSFFDSIGKYYSLGMDAFSMEIIMRMVP